MPKDEVATLMAMLELIFTSSALEARKGMSVAVMNFSGAFLHVPNEDDMIMTMIRKLIELMVMIALQIYTNTSSQTISMSLCCT